MTKDQITKEIADVTAKIASYNAAKASYEREIAVSQASYNQCSGIGKKKCQENRQKEISQWQALINQQAANISTASAQLASLNSALEAANEAEVQLATAGVSQAAAIEVAKGQASAVQKQAEIEATANAEIRKADAGNESLRKTMITGSIVIGVLVVAAILGFALSKKFGKKSKKIKK